MHAKKQFSIHSPSLIYFLIAGHLSTCDRVVVTRPGCHTRREMCGILEADRNYPTELCAHANACADCGTCAPPWMPIIYLLVWHPRQVTSTIPQHERATPFFEFSVLFLIFCQKFGRAGHHHHRHHHDHHRTDAISFRTPKRGSSARQTRKP